MSAPVRVQVEAEVNTATQDLWRLAEIPADTPGETNATEQLKHLLARGADINARNRQGVTALMIAAYNGRVQMVRALIDHGADLNATREYGFTPLALAAFRGHTEVVRVLVERGADLNKATPFGTSAEAWATARSFSEIALYLEQSGSSAPESSANHFGVMPAPSEIEPAAEVPTAEPVRAEQPTQTLHESEPDNDVSNTEPIRAEQPPPSDSELTMETPRSAFPDQLIAQHQEENRGPGHENEQASAKPLVVRTLKDPPEIWDLVHEAPREFNPGGAFVTRLTSSKTNLVLLTLAVLFIVGLSTFAVMTLRERKRADAAAQVERGTSQTVPGSQPSAPASAAVNEQLNTQLDKTPGGPDNTQPQPTNPQPTDSQVTLQRDNGASAGAALTDGIQPTGESVNDISTRAASRAGAPAWSGNKRATLASRGRNADKSSPARGESETATASDTGAVLKQSDEKRSNDSASATKRSNTTSSPQSIAPPTTSSTPKAKVIQWP